MTNWCKNCGSVNIEFTQDFELINPETDKLEKHDGLLCTECGCFHSVVDNFFQYEPEPEKEKMLNYSLD